MNARAIACVAQPMATQMTLIDPLDQRLLFSADHPLGLAISLADLQDDDTQIEDAALVSALLVELEQERLATADESGIAASDETFRSCVE